ncbi:hypothetical protein ACQ4PT_001269 [Festuca glaucescens]
MRQDPEHRPPPADAAAVEVPCHGAHCLCPAGHVAVCVGDASRRFVVRAAHLNHPVFRELLRQAAEEYGFPSSPGPVALPCCDEDRFLDVLRRVSSDEERLLIRAGRSFCCRVPPVTTTRGVAARPLLQGMAVEKLVW